MAPTTQTTTVNDANKRLVARIDAYMAEWLDERPMPENLREALVYALLAPGKRMRPILTFKG